MRKKAYTVFLSVFILCLNISDNSMALNRKQQILDESVPKSLSLDARISPDNPLKPDLERIDHLFHHGSDKNGTLRGVRMLKESLNLCEQIMQKHPENYEVLWRYARGAYKYAESVKGLQLDGWKKTCGALGRNGMKIAGKAQTIEPNRVEAYFWQTTCIGEYIYDAGIVTAIKEGFYPVSMRSMKKAYELDKTYYNYIPVFGMAMLFYTPPWPLQNKRKALKFLEEHRKNASYIWEDYIMYTHGADFLLSLKRDKFNNEASLWIYKILNEHQEKKFYYQWARRLEKKIKKTANAPQQHSY